MRGSFGDDLVAMLPRLRRFAMALCRRADAADDLVQIACEKALASAGSWQPGTRFDAWMFRILRNAWIDQLRRRKTAGIQEDISEREDIAGSRGDVEIEAALTLAKVWRMIDELPPDQKEVLLLVAVEGWSYKEAAEALELPIGTVMSRLARARLKIAGKAGIN
jgi:RNA polymerase sigma-70 factor (ECF subfamily)